MRRSPRLALALAAALLAGCGTVYVNPEDRDKQFTVERRFESPRGVELTYRRIFYRLYDCLSVYDYRVHGEFGAGATAARIHVDSGIGLERSLYLADSYIMRVDIEPAADGRSVVTVHGDSRRFDTFHEAIELWVTDDFQGCRA